MVAGDAITGNRRQMRQIIRRCMAIANELPRLNRITTATGVVTKDVVVEAAADIRLEVPQPPETPTRDNAPSVPLSVPPKRDYVKLLRNAIDQDVQARAMIDISRTKEFAAIRAKITDPSYLCKLILESARFRLLEHEFTANEISEAWRAGEGSSGISNFLKRNCQGALKELYGEIPLTLAAVKNRTAGALFKFARQQFTKSGDMVEIK